MKRRYCTLRFWVFLVVAGGALVLPAGARAGNIVLNPGFEQGGCGNTPVLCGWAAELGSIGQDTDNPHSGSASMGLSGLSGVASAVTDPAFCTPVSPGTLAASFWYRTPDSGDPEWNAAVVWVSATFYSAAGCTGSATYVEADASPILDDAWHQGAGNLIAPSGTVSASFGVGVAAGCNLCLLVSAHVDDLDVEAGPDTAPPETTITSGPPGTTTSTSATFEFSASEPATFECRLDAAAFSACTSPVTYSGLGYGIHTFDVRATDAAGNTDPTPAERTWTVQPNQPPVASFTLNCSALTCSFDGGGSSDADGSIVGYTWSFGDGSSGTGATATHTYSQAAAHTVTLTVTDDSGASGTQSKVVTLIGLTARAYRAKALQKVDLAWSGPAGVSFDVYRNGVKIATVAATAYTDTVKKGPGAYTYRVCAPTTSVCSNDASVSF